MARQTVDQVSDDLDKLTDRCEEVRKDVNSLELKLALLYQKTHTVEKDLAGLLSSFSWALRTVFGLILAAAVAFIISGGLSI